MLIRNIFMLTNSRQAHFLRNLHLRLRKFYLRQQRTNTKVLQTFQKSHLQGALNFTTPHTKQSQKLFISHQHCIAVCLASCHCPPLEKFSTDGTIRTTVRLFPVKTNISFRSRESFNTLRPKYCRFLFTATCQHQFLPHGSRWARPKSKNCYWTIWHCRCVENSGIDPLGAVYGGCKSSQLRALVDH